ncbi:hypothetical protein CPSG_04406 [Coccidioides posadasii str. Silveira]|uniref:Uncharacterized protein n=1 Tax=Coccidioides posadasii (strain RMSCC 757 / Silveira) TaxID=443226 RepID=E9D467_COCPS|nr:hypothetical protein CPSG_04406 [Coccidioides posadasii str. Silveira]
MKVLKMGDIKLNPMYSGNRAKLLFKEGNSVESTTCGPLLERHHRSRCVYFPGNHGVCLVRCNASSVVGRCIGRHHCHSPRTLHPLYLTGIGDNLGARRAVDHKKLIPMDASLVGMDFIGIVCTSATWPPKWRALSSGPTFSMFDGDIVLETSVCINGNTRVCFEQDFATRARRALRMTDYL